MSIEDRDDEVPIRRSSIDTSILTREADSALSDVEFELDKVQTIKEDIELYGIREVTTEWRRSNDEIG